MELTQEHKDQLLEEFATGFKKRIKKAEYGRHTEINKAATVWGLVNDVKKILTATAEKTNEKTLFNEHWEDIPAIRNADFLKQFSLQKPVLQKINDKYAGREVIDSLLQNILDVKPEHELYEWLHHIADRRDFSPKYTNLTPKKCNINKAVFKGKYSIEEIKGFVIPIAFKRYEEIKDVYFNNPESLKRFIEEASLALELVDGEIKEISSEKKFEKYTIDYLKGNMPLSSILNKAVEERGETGKDFAKSLGMGPKVYYGLSSTEIETLGNADDREKIAKIFVLPDQYKNNSLLRDFIKLKLTKRSKASNESKIFDTIKKFNYELEDIVNFIAPIALQQYEKIPQDFLNNEMNIQKLNDFLLLTKLPHFIEEGVLQYPPRDYNELKAREQENLATTTLLSVTGEITLLQAHKKIQKPPLVEKKFTNKQFHDEYISSHRSIFNDACYTIRTYLNPDNRLSLTKILVNDYLSIPEKDKELMTEWIYYINDKTKGMNKQEIKNYKKVTQTVKDGNYSYEDIRDFIAPIALGKLDLIPDDFLNEGKNREKVKAFIQKTELQINLSEEKDSEPQTLPKNLVKIMEEPSGLTRISPTPWRTLQ